MQCIRCWVIYVLEILSACEMTFFEKKFIFYLGIGSKKSNDEAANRRQLEQRIAQLESDAREQDRKAQLILANVQSRFSSVQSKYETHISDLETQVLR